MNGFAKELLTIERSGFDARSGIVGLAVLSVFALTMVVVGPVAMAAALGALVVLSADTPPPGVAETALERLKATVIGVAIAFVVLAFVDASDRTRRAAA